MPANPKLSSKVHLGTKKKSFSSSLVQNILIMQILTSNYVSVHNPDMPTHTLVLADRSSLSIVRYPLLDACIWDASRNPLLAHLHSPLFICRSLLAACWSVIAAYCSLYVIRLMVLLASRSSTYAAPGILLLIACYTSTFSPIFFAEEISCSSFAARCLLYAASCMLLTTCYSLLPFCCLLPEYCLVLSSRWLEPFFLVARLSPFTARWLNAYFMPFGYYLLAAHGSLFAFFCFWLVANKSPIAPRS